MSERIDDIDVYYKAVKSCDTVSGVLFWICAVLALATPYADKVFPSEYLHYVNGLFIVLVLLQVGASTFNSIHLLPKAEGKRRQQLLSDSFGVPLSFDRTQGYYNNYLSPSVARLGANVLENTHFTKAICAEMVKSARLWNGLYLVLWVVMLIDRHADLGFVLAATQVLFSGEIIVKWAQLETLRNRTERIHDDLCTHYRNRIDNTGNMGIAEVLEAFTAYEAAKSAAAVCLSTKVFTQLNDSLSEKWDQIRQDLQIDAEELEAE